MPALRALQSLREAIARELKSRSGVTIETAADPMDGILAAVDRDATLENLHRTAERYRDVAAAIRRIESGEFGYCEDCDETIAANRLMAVPWARRCIRCQELRERVAA